MSEYGRVPLPENSKAFLEAEIILRKRDLVGIEKRLNAISHDYYRRQKDADSHKLEQENQFLLDQRIKIRLEYEELKKKLDAINRAEIKN